MLDPAEEELQGAMLEGVPSGELSEAAMDVLHCSQIMPTVFRALGGPLQER